MEWKEAVVVPVFKKGSNHLITNYRPIYLFNIVSKVQERIVFNKLYKLLSPILAAHQSGFKKNDGTHLQLSRLVQEWSEATDSSNYVAAVFF